MFQNKNHRVQIVFGPFRRVERQIQYLEKPEPSAFLDSLDARNIRF